MQASIAKCLLVSTTVNDRLIGILWLFYKSSSPPIAEIQQKQPQGQPEGDSRGSSRGSSGGSSRAAAGAVSAACRQRCDEQKFCRNKSYEQFIIGAISDMCIHFQHLDYLCLYASRSQLPQSLLRIYFASPSPPPTPYELHTSVIFFFKIEYW